MHRITGDGFIIDGGKNRYAAEDLPGRDATMVTHQAMNAIQEEIAAVIEAEGLTLNSASETYGQMVQLNAAINNKIKAPRGYIDGFNLKCTDGGVLNIGAGAALNSANQKWLRKDTATTKAMVAGGALQTWVAGTGNGGVKSSDLAWWGTAVGTWDGVPTPTDVITNIADTSNMRVGDHILADSNKDIFGYTWATIKTILSGSSIQIDRTLATDGTAITLTHTGRWYHVFAIGQTANPAAFDLVLALDIAAFGGGIFGAWDILRRIGSVFVLNNVGTPLVMLFESFGDDFVFRNYLDRNTVSAWPVGGATTSDYRTLRTLSPRQINTLADTEAYYDMPSATGKRLQIVYRDGGGYGAAEARAIDMLYPDGTSARQFYRKQKSYTGIENNIQISFSGGNPSVYATADLTLYTSGYRDPRGKDA